MTRKSSPLVTFALFSFNQEKYISRAVEAAFSQDYSPLEIIISDDCSTDGTFNKILSLVDAYRGPHKVAVRRNSKNLGLADHVNTVMRLSLGEVIVIAAGDDIAHPNRVASSVALLQKYPQANSVILSADLINDDGATIGSKILVKESEESTLTFNSLLRGEASTFGAARAIRRELFEFFGPFNAACPTEDSTFLLRSLLRGSCVLSRNRGVYYRVHGSNLSSASSLSGMNTHAIYSQYLSDFELASRVTDFGERQARNFYRWLSQDYQLRQLRVRAGLGFGLRFGDFVGAMSLKNFPWRTRLQLVRSFLNRRGRDNV